VSETRTLLLLRHAEAEETRPGSRDRDRRLSERGREQAAAVGETIRSAGWAVDHVLCSPAERVRETVAGLELPEDVEVEVVDALYDAGSDNIIESNTPLSVRSLAYESVPAMSARTPRWSVHGTSKVENEVAVRGSLTRMWSMPIRGGILLLAG
jgi:Histidine phosphatase superfamily (branch 1)